MMEKDLLKLGAKVVVRSQGFSEVDFRFTHLTMMKRDVYVLKKDLEQFEQLSESSDTEDDVRLVLHVW